MRGNKIISFKEALPHPPQGQQVAKCKNRREILIILLFIEITKSLAVLFTLKILYQKIKITLQCLCAHRATSVTSSKPTVFRLPLTKQQIRYFKIRPYFQILGGQEFWGRHYPTQYRPQPSTSLDNLVEIVKFLFFLNPFGQIILKLPLLTFRHFKSKLCFFWQTSAIKCVSRVCDEV